MGDGGRQPAGQRIDYASTLTGRTKAVILFGVLLSLFLAALDQTIVATALPRIISELQGLDLFAWTSTSYLLTSTAMVPIYGKLSDIYGRKIILLVGIFVFLGGSALCGVAPSMLWLVIFRGVQGVGAAALTSTAFSVPADLFAPSERARFQGIFGAVFGLASVVGPYVGGLLTDHLGWRWVFYVNLPLGVVATVFIIAKMPKLHAGIRSRIDYVGSGLLLVAVVPLLLALTLDHADHPWTSPLILGLFAVAAVGTALFIWVEHQSEAPIIPLGLFRMRAFALIIPASALVGAALMLTVMFLSIYLVNVLGVSATTAGTTLIPLTFSMVVSSMLSSVVVQRLGKWKVPVLLGLVLIGLGFAWLTTLHPDTTLNGVRLRMVVVGLGLGPNMPLLNLVLQNAVPFEAVGTATASRQFFQQLGQAIAVAIFGVMLTNQLSASMEANLAPIRAGLPPDLAQRFDVSHARNGVALEGGGPHVPLSDRIEQEIHKAFAEQKALLIKAVRDNDPAAVQAVLANPRAPEKAKELLRSGGVAAAVHAQLAAQKQKVAQGLRDGKLSELQEDPSLPAPVREGLSRVPPFALASPEATEKVIARLTSQMDAREPEVVKQATEQAVAGLEQGLASAEAAAVVRGVETGRKIEDALKRSFTTAITHLYWNGVPMVALALLLMLFVPQTPLRKSNVRPPEPVMA